MNEKVKAVDEDIEGEITKLLAQKEQQPEPTKPKRRMVKTA